MNPIFSTHMLPYVSNNLLYCKKLYIETSSRSKIIYENFFDKLSNLKLFDYISKKYFQL